MKNDHSFKIIAAVIMMGVFLAMFNVVRAVDGDLKGKEIGSVSDVGRGR